MQVTQLFHLNDNTRIMEVNCHYIYETLQKLPQEANCKQSYVQYGAIAAPLIYCSRCDGLRMQINVYNKSLLGHL